MQILVSNDDGIYSPGLAALADVAAHFGEVRVVAPDVEQSSMGQAITSSRPLSYRPAALPGCRAFRVNGTPSDCVALGLHHWGQVELVLSGINLGPNLGNAIWHSGTVAAAKQAALLGVRSIAISAPGGDSEGEGEPDYETIKPWVKKALDLLLPIPELPLVNVNVPRQPRGMQWTRQSVRHYDGKMAPATDPMGRRHFWHTVVPVEGVEPGTDRWAMEHDMVSITPLRLDLTSERELDHVRRIHPLETRAGPSG